MPACRQGVVEADFLGGHGFDFDDFGVAGGVDESAVTMRLASAASVAQWTVPPAVVTACFELQEVVVEVAQGVVFDGGAGGA